MREHGDRLTNHVHVSKWRRGYCNYRTNLTVSQLAVGNPNTPFPLKEIGFWGKKKRKRKQSAGGLVN
jgi:hypothetical protein